MDALKPAAEKQLAATASDGKAADIGSAIIDGSNTTTNEFGEEVEIVPKGS